VRGSAPVPRVVFLLYGVGAGHYMIVEELPGVGTQGEGVRDISGAGDDDVCGASLLMRLCAGIRDSLSKFSRLSTAWHISTNVATVVCPGVSWSPSARSPSSPC
jgi:hypothetical protein